MKYIGLYLLLITSVSAPTANAQTKLSNVPNTITRNIAQDKNGNIWAAAFDGVFRYDGKTFTNAMLTVSSARFFSVLEDKEGNMWFGTIGSGVYRYDGKTYRNFTTKDGLINNEVNWIFEDKAGNIWFGVNGGASCYDGKSFRNFLIEGQTLVEDKTGKTFPDFTRPPNEVTSIIEDNTGKLWFATRGNTYIYDGKAFKTLTYNNHSFQNVRTMAEDKKGNIWFGGNDGLWRYDGSSFTNFSRNFVGYVYADKSGNIWTSSQSGNKWAISRYDEKTLFNGPPFITEVATSNGTFGILEATDGAIWFGTVDGVYRYDGKSVASFK